MCKNPIGDIQMFARIIYKFFSQLSRSPRRKILGVRDGLRTQQEPQIPYSLLFGFRYSVHGRNIAALPIGTLLRVASRLWRTQSRAKLFHLSEKL